MHGILSARRTIYSDQLSGPRFTGVNTDSSTVVVYYVQRQDFITTRVITGFEVIRFGVPMMGWYANVGRRKRVTINPAVPGAQYRITAWALNSGTRRSTRPAVLLVTTREASELH